MNAKPMARVHGNASWNTSTPIRNCSVGPMYCTSPMVDSGISRAP